MRTKIIVLQESGLSYAEIAKQLDGSVTTSGVQKFCVLYHEANSIKNKARKTKKGTLHLLMTQELTRYIIFKIEECHQ